MSHILDDTQELARSASILARMFGWLEEGLKPCPHCGSRQTHPVMTDDGDQGVRECETCAKQFSARGSAVPGTRFGADGRVIQPDDYAK